MKDGTPATGIMAEYIRKFVGKTCDVDGDDDGPCRVKSVRLDGRVILLSVETADGVREVPAEKCSNFRN